MSKNEHFLLITFEPLEVGAEILAQCAHNAGHFVYQFQVAATISY